MAVDREGPIRAWWLGWRRPCNADYPAGLCLTIIILVAGALFVFLAQWAAYKYRYLRGIRDDLRFDSPNQRYVVQELGKTLTMVENCERWAEEVVPLGLMLSVGVVLALAVLIPF